MNEYICLDDVLENNKPGNLLRRHLQTAAALKGLADDLNDWIARAIRVAYAHVTPYTVEVVTHVDLNGAILVNATYGGSCRGEHWDEPLCTNVHIDPDVLTSKLDSLIAVFAAHKAICDSEIAKIEKEREDAEKAESDAQAFELYKELHARFGGTGRK